MLTADSVPPRPSSNTGMQSEMDYSIVPQANTLNELQDKRSQVSDDKTTQEKYSKMDVKLWESQRGGEWQWQGSLTGRGHDSLNVAAGNADQKWYIKEGDSTKRVQMVIGKDSAGNLIKAWTVHVDIYPTGPVFKKGD